MDKFSVLALVLSEWREMYQTHQMSDHTLACAFILAWLATVHGSSRCLSGPIRPHIYTDTEKEKALHNASVRLCDIPHLCDILGINAVRMMVRWCGVECVNDVSMGLLFNRVRLHPIKQNKNNCVNVCLLEWMIGARPFEMLFYIPTPMEVLQMQANGRRVVSVLITGMCMCTCSGEGVCACE